jgi:hypothetical protein
MGILRAQFAMMRITNSSLLVADPQEGVDWRERFRAVITIFMTLLAINFAAVLYTETDTWTHNWEPCGTGKGAAAICTELRWPVAAMLYFLHEKYILLYPPDSEDKLQEVITREYFWLPGAFDMTLNFCHYVGRCRALDISLRSSGQHCCIVVLWFYFLVWLLSLVESFHKLGEIQEKTAK